MLDVERVFLPFSNLGINNDDLLSGNEGKFQFVPNIRIIHRYICEAYARLLNALVDSVDRNVHAIVFIDPLWD